MARLGRQATDQLFDRRGSQIGQVVAAPSGQPLGQCRAAGDGRRAASGQIPHFADYPVLDPYRELQNIATGWVGDFDGRVRSFHGAHIARVTEMLKQQFGVHPDILAAAELTCSRARDTLLVRMGDGERVMTVVAAVMERGSQVLICQRRPNERHALKWEFPGGKVEKGESLEQALQRELVEELGIQATIGPEIKRYRFASNSRGGILLIFFRVTEFTGEIENRIFARVVWEQRAKLPEYAFLEGDVAFVNELAAGSR